MPKGSTGYSTSPVFTTCWQNCPAEGSVSVFGNNCPAGYPNSTRPDCTPRICWSNCPNLTSISVFGSCPSNWPNTIKPTCYEPEEQILDAFNEAIIEDDAFATNENIESTQLADDGKGDDDFGFETTQTTYDEYTDDKDEFGLPPNVRTCYSDCPVSVPVSIIGETCPPTYPYSSKQECGGAYDPVNEALIAQMEEQIAQQQQAMQDLVDAQSAGSAENQQQIQALLDLINSQQTQIALAEQSNQGQQQISALESQLATLQQALLTASSQPAQSDTSDAVAGLTSQFAMLQQQLLDQQNQYQQDLYDRQYAVDTQKAGFGDVPMWAVISGIALVGLITFLATRK